MRSFLIILLSLTPLISFSQFEYGLRSSITQISINNKHTDYTGGVEVGHSMSFEGQKNIEYGGFFNLHLNKSLKLKSELLFAKNNFSAKEHNWDNSYLFGENGTKNDAYEENINHQFNINSLNLNFLLVNKIYFVDFELGINYNTPTKAIDNITSATKEYINRNEGVFNIEGTLYNMNEINKKRVNLILGLSKNINSSFTINLRYTKGLKPFRENDSDVDKIDFYTLGLDIHLNRIRL